MVPFITTWAALAAIVLVLAVYRSVLASHEEPTTSLHVAAGSAAAAHDDLRVEKRLAVVDRWGQILTVVGAIYGLVLAGIYLYHVWLSSASTPPQ